MDSRPPAELDSLYSEAVALADRSRAWFDGPGVAWRAALPARARAAVATEALAITARLMASIAWLLDRNHLLPDGRLPSLAFRPEADRPDGMALFGSPGAEIAAESRRLFSRIAEQAGSPAVATADPVVPDGPAPDNHQQDVNTIWRQ